MQDESNNEELKVAETEVASDDATVSYKYGDDGVPACGDDERIASLESEISELESKLSAALSDKDKETDKLKDVNGMYIRLQSDFDNYRKRTAEQLKHTKEDGIADAMTQVIPVLDVIHQALKMITDEKVAEGVRMIDRQLAGVLGGFGVREIAALGKPFDPEIHNAILQVKAEKDSDRGTVIEVFQKGYAMGDRILRHSVVKVAQ